MLVEKIRLMIMHPNIMGGWQGDLTSRDYVSGDLGIRLACNETNLGGRGSARDGA
jgi:hypothetical protein